jgi:hypothetical protein
MNGEQSMQKEAKGRTEEFSLKVQGIKVNAQEKKALQAAVKVLNEQSERLGILDALDAEPATVFFAEERKR